MKNILALFLGILLPTQSFAGGHAYNSWKPHGFNKVDSETYRVDSAGESISVTFFTDNPNISSIQMYFDEVAEATYTYLSSQVEIGRGTRLGRCHSWRIVVYDMSEAFVNNRSVVYWYPWRDQYQRMYGMYDSNYTDSSNTAAIIVRNDMPNLKRKQTLAHELVHYWWDMCVSDGMGEQHAQAAEQLFQ